MNQPVFKNRKPYEIKIPTPYGGSRTVGSGKYVAGDYFGDLYTQTDLLQRMPAGFEPAPQDLICIYTKNQMQREYVASVLQTTPEQIRKEAIEQYVEKDTKSVETNKNEDSQLMEEKAEVKKGRPPKKSLYDATKEAMSAISTVLPSPSEVDSMPMKEMVKIARKIGVSTTLDREDMITMLKQRLAE